VFPERETWVIVPSEKSRSKFYQTKEYKMGGIFEITGDKKNACKIWSENKERKSI
jgi:hypothetical protein